MIQMVTISEADLANMMSTMQGVQEGLRYLYKLC